MKPEIKPIVLTYWREYYPKEVGISIEVVKGEKSYTGKPCWNTYLYIHNKEMVDYLWSDYCRKYDWGEVWIPKDMLEELDWNGGQTLYHQAMCGSHRYIKVGDDYQHSWDEGKEHDEHRLINNIRHIAEQFQKAWNQRTPNG